MPRLIFVNRIVHPDISATSQLLSQLAISLAADGWNVEVVTSRMRYDDRHCKLSARETVKFVLPSPDTITPCCSALPFPCCSRSHWHRWQRNG